MPICPQKLFFKISDASERVYIQEKFAISPYNEMNFPIAILVYELILQIFRKIVLIMIIDFLLFYDFNQETQGCYKVNMVKTESNIARGMVKIKTQIWRSFANVFSSGKKNNN